MLQIASISSTVPTLPNIVVEFPNTGLFKPFCKRCRINCCRALLFNLGLAIVIVFGHERSFRIRCFISDVHLVGLHKKPVIEKCIGKLPSLETPKLYKWVVILPLDTLTFSAVQFKCHWSLSRSPVNKNIAIISGQATSHYLKQWWFSLFTHICVIRRNDCEALLCQ